MIRSERIARDIEDFAQIGRTGETAVTRLAFTAEGERAFALFHKKLAPYAHELTRDPWGNAFARFGKQPRAAILIGSHLDTVRNGGRFDGAAGVVVGMEILRVLHEEKIQLRHPIEVVAFEMEEGARFGSPVVGSQVMLGKADANTLARRRDKDGMSLATAFAVLGRYHDFAEAVRASARDSSNVAAYLELHIEQGRTLESEQIDLGIVTSIAAAVRYSITFTGQADHSGAAPMTLRKDALVCAAEAVLEIERRAKATGPPLVATVGELEIADGSMNVVPGRVRMSLDIRDIDCERRYRFATQILESISEMAERRDICIDIESISAGKPVVLSNDVRAALSQAATILEYSTLEMPSGAGHDAMHFAACVPTGMLFVPSKGGRSHCPEEFTPTEEIVRGAECLLRALLLLDERLP